MACLGCTSCSTGKDSEGKAGGCQSNGGCSTGGCNRHNTYDWITALGISDPNPFDVVEVSFKNGSRKDFFKNPSFTRTATGDEVLVESPAGGFDLGKISLSGELVRLQMKRKHVRNDAKLGSVIRKAHERDLERLDEIRRSEKDVMIRSRAIARTLDLRMKVCDVEFQGDGRKCTFFYTADGRVDFRELIRLFAKEFKVKIEMRQIGARQESARIGGLGNCGRELCCSTWLSEFKSVNTAAARYQNLAINQTKLSGMCGRLKCCLNYELDTYIDALEDFPDKAEKFKTKTGLAILMKTDVFKRLMFYTYADNKTKFYALHVDQVWDALAMVKGGDIPGSLDDILAMAPPPDEVEEVEIQFENVDNVIQLPMEKRKKKKKSKNINRGESAAAAVERAEQSEQMRAKGGNRQGGQQQRGDRPQRPQGNPNQRPQGDNRPPQDNPNQKPKGENRPPQGNPNQRPQGENRPPQGNPNQKPKGENRPPQGNPNQKPKGENRPPQGNPNQRPPQNSNKPPRNPDNKPKDSKPPAE